MAIAEQRPACEGNSCVGQRHGRPVDVPGVGRRTLCGKCRDRLERVFKRVVEGTNPRKPANTFVFAFACPECGEYSTRAPCVRMADGTLQVECPACGFVEWIDPGGDTR